MRLIHCGPKPEPKPWWDTELTRRISYKAMPGMILARILCGASIPQPDNDRDHIRW